MARQVECGEFLVIEATAREMFVAVGSPGICDYCDAKPEKGYYVAVMNSWYCPECFERFKRMSKHFAEDRPVEVRNFHYYGMKLGVL